MPRVRTTSALKPHKMETCLNRIQFLFALSLEVRRWFSSNFIQGLLGNLSFGVSSAFIYLWRSWITEKHYHKIQTSESSSCYLSLLLELEKVFWVKNLMQKVFLWVFFGLVILVRMSLFSSQVASRSEKRSTIISQSRGINTGLYFGDFLHLLEAQKQIFETVRSTFRRLRCILRTFVRGFSRGWWFMKHSWTIWNFEGSELNFSFIIPFWWGEISFGLQTSSVCSTSFAGGLHLCFPQKL